MHRMIRSRCWMTVHSIASPWNLGNVHSASLFTSGDLHRNDSTLPRLRPELCLFACFTFSPSLSLSSSFPPLLFSYRRIYCSLTGHCFFFLLPLLLLLFVVKLSLLTLRAQMKASHKLRAINIRWDGCNNYKGERLSHTQMVEWSKL